MIEHTYLEYALASLRLLPCCGILNIENGVFVNRNETDRGEPDRSQIAGERYETEYRRVSSICRNYFY